MGFSRGSILSICSPNVPEYCSVFFGALASGGTVSPVNPTYTAGELAYQFENSATDMIATVPALLPTVQKAAEKVGVKKIIAIGREGESCNRSSNLIAYDHLLEDSGSAFNQVFVDAKQDIAVLPYSSGTTGLPKGVMVTHYNITTNILQLGHSELLYLHKEGTTLLGVLPFFHMYGMVTVLFSSLYAGSKVVSLSKFEPELFLNAITKFKTELVHVVPPLILFLAKHPTVVNYDLSCIRQITAGAAPLGRELVETARSRLKCDVIRQVYGLTESGCVHMAPASLSKEKPQSVGVPIKSMDVKVVDPETNEALSAGEEGEVLIRGPNIMKGYLNLPDATRSCITGDGWFRTGDIGHFDKDGWFYITDRLKELIKVKGLQVAPAELEALLVTHEKIADAAVVGVTDERLGEAPRAYVVKDDCSLQEREVEEYIARRVAKHKHLVGGVQFVDAIPKSASGKILRRLLK
ncbi:Probable 4-coumarate--CoA ligase 1 [Geodia barretti]|uniref:Probable 4-coumarate--CoA ligase 1 n=4 Tax=Geodia barretti TaxID=519541 RepID=A0AA35SD84_GEOBA|nr:Probable 4-coumarate--CoA ligase 1 [Geodia barretti]